ncbi:hypothetical protein PISL3812_02902 [Talaromyces islandicus]|uniref:SMP-30/Gluconolactonase/LRE-like region domain-containing protein n=1 Tax=Talaromyces islandicus TaxID=28573 RepID=A0A0U1LR71_TALIS|nr:hypothetical protein PISL3812_02902 [Talaromyces islandicus]
MLLSGVSQTRPFEPQPQYPFLPSKILYQFNQTPTWIENLAPRPNGHFLLSQIADSGGNLYEFDPAFPFPTLVHSFSREDNNTLNSILGIAEIGIDVYAVIVAENKGALVNLVAGPSQVWKVDLSEFDPFSPPPSNRVKVEKIADIPLTTTPNGLVALPKLDTAEDNEETGRTLLIGDSAGGIIWSVNTLNGQSAVVLNTTETMAPADGGWPLGVNGVRVFPGDSSHSKEETTLYWTNSARGTFNRAKIDIKTAKVNGKIQVLASTGMFLDDFTLDKDGNAWVAANANNTVIVIGNDANGHQVVPVVGGQNETIIEGCTSTHFGTGIGDQHILYVTTSGGVFAPIKGNITEPGRVVAVDTLPFNF